MSSIYEKIDNRLETFLSTLKRFPLASFSAFLFTVIMLVLMDYKNYDSPNAIMASKIAFVATLGILLFPALQLLGRSVLFPLLGVILLGVYYYFLPHDLHNMGFNIGLRHILLGLALFFMILWSPFVFRKSDNDTFWQYAQAIIFGLITAIFFTLIVFGGLAAALYAIEKLFGFDVRSVRYGQLALMVFGIFGINFFLSQIPKHPLFMQVRPYSKIKRIFSKNILAPIAIVYFLILFAYTAKILINMTFPTGTLSWIIVAFSFVAIVSFLFLSPYLKKSSLTQRFIWLAIFLQTIMLGFALWMRVEEYGITYNRYLLAMFGLWLVLMSLYFMLFGKAQQKWLFFFASLFILFSQFGTYSAKNLTKKSQTTRLIKLIEMADPRSEELEMKKKYEISDSIDYIHKHYGEDAFETIIPHILKKYKKEKKVQKVQKIDGRTVVTKVDNSYPYYMYNFPSFATHELGFKFVNQWQWVDYKRNNGKIRKESHYFYVEDSQKYINLKDYSHLINYHYNQHMYMNPRFQKELQENQKISLSKNVLYFNTDNNSSITFDLSNYVDELRKKEFISPNVPQKILTYEETKENLHIKVLFQRLNLSSDGNITDFNSQILLKYKEK
ncbi:MAG TPA: DUF4153 domain-containing protein [Campylobacterales bacterium]|nr:DUF4153 domain-containing protein [Campylobacterales bacterium]